MANMPFQSSEAAPAVRNQSAPNFTGATRVTWIGLVVSLFGLILIRDAMRLIFPAQTTSVVAAREALFWVSAIGLLWLVRRLEKLPLTSIGLGTSVWWKSVLWGLVTALLCGAAGGLLVWATGYGHSSASAAFAALPLWLITLIVFRAGFVEELFLRGYAIERLQLVGMGRYVAAAISLVIFALGHYTGGAANILIALVLGGILTGAYLWRRDLVANIVAHTLVDFVGNVLPALFGK
jgi:membrane protease YdiL (CAAX protease family)